MTTTAVEQVIITDVPRAKFDALAQHYHVHYLTDTAVDDNPGRWVEITTDSVKLVLFSAE